MRYSIIQITDDINLFNNTVQQHLKQGWECQGGVAISTFIKSSFGGTGVVSVLYVQAIIKKVEIK